MESLTVAEINLGQLEKNYNIIKSKASGSYVMCAVKANAYGMGEKECTETLYKAGCRHFAVANLYEAIKIKDYAKDAEVLVLGYTSPENIGILIENGFSQTVYSYDYAELIYSHIPEDKKLKCHIKIDTGMNRLGFKYYESENDSFEQLVDIYKRNKLDIRGTFTHFYNSELSKEDTEEQYKRFVDTVEKLKEKGVKPGLCHASNSAAIFSYPEMKLDMVRAGIILYGFNPCKDTSSECKPIVELKTKISHIHEIDKGESVGYDKLFVADRKMKIATICLGYGDGFLRSYNGEFSKSKTRGYVVIKNKKAPILGNICMDQCMCDITGIDAKIGDDVIIIDKDNPVDVFCEAANTISYEFITLLTDRVERKYIY